MLTITELASTAAAFGVAEEQVRRDHLLSHLLAVLSDEVAEQVVFFGGTALARTLLPHSRLSEDLDLIAVGSRGEVARTVESVVVRGVRREYPGLQWDPRLSAVRDTETAVLHSPDGLAVRVQLLDSLGYPRWPTAPTDLVQRYSDARPARLSVPTGPSFAAWKTVAYAERRAPRDLFDLWGLAQMGSVNEEAVELYERLGPTGRPPAAHVFAEAPDESQWQRELASQTRLTVTAATAVALVRQAWRDVR